MILSPYCYHLVANRIEWMDHSDKSLVQCDALRHSLSPKHKMQLNHMLERNAKCDIQLHQEAHSCFPDSLGAQPYNSDAKETLEKCEIQRKHFNPNDG